MVALVAVAGCGSSSDLPPPPLPPICPDAAVLEGANSIAAFDGADQRQSELRHLAVISDLVDSCAYDDGGVAVDLSFKLIAERGPRHGDGPLELRYFVATVAPGARILDKQVLESAIVFPAGEPNAGVSEDLTLRIPNVTVDDGSAYRVFIGFQLDEAQLEQQSRPFFR